jgi:hypothetical protein
MTSDPNHYPDNAHDATADRIIRCTTIEGDRLLDQDNPDAAAYAYATAILLGTLQRLSRQAADKAARGIWEAWESDSHVVDYLGDMAGEYTDVEPAGTAR